MAALYTPTLTYDPITDPDGLRATHYQIERSPGDGFIYEAMFDPHTGTATPFYHSDSLIIATAGSFRHEMFCYPGPRASYAVFVGPGNALNDAEKSLLAPPGTFQSLHRGELWGTVAALQTVVRILEKGLVTYGPLRRVIIKTDSEYIAKGGTERMLTWLSKGWIGNGESHIRDWDLWEAFLAWLEIVKRTWNVEVLLWEPRCQVAGEGGTQASSTQIDTNQAYAKKRASKLGIDRVVLLGEPIERGERGGFLDPSWNGFNYLHCPQQRLYKR